MFFLDDNPLANMYGPYFLVFYCLLFVIFGWLALRKRRSLDTSANMPPLPVPENPNPYEVAYFRGGEAEVAKLMILELFQRGILVDARPTRLGKQKLQLAENVNLESLDPTLRSLAATFSVPRGTGLMDTKRMPSLLGAQLERWSNWTRNEQLVFNPSERDESYSFAMKLAVAFATVGIYKLVVALMHGHYNVIFLGVMLMLAPPGLLALAQLPRFTARGRRYLQDLQTAYSSYKNSVLPEPDVYEPQASSSAAWDPLLVGSYAMPVMAMGLFGASALQSSYYRGLRNQYTSDSTGSSCGGAMTCGSSCSGGASAGGDGGGGGAGCGGGGGGCGGGCGGCGS